MINNIDINDVLATVTPCANYDDAYWAFYYEVTKLASEKGSG